MIRTVDKAQVAVQEEIADCEDPEEVSTVTVSSLARQFRISKSALKKQLAKRNIRTEIIMDEYFSPQTNAFVQLGTTHLLVWQVELAIQIAHEIYYRSNRRPSAVRIRQVA